MASFIEAYKRVIRAEGGYQNDPDDTGNYNSLGQLVGTNHGINAQVYESYIGRPPSMADMMLMLISIAQEIYRKNYWNRVKGDSINNQFLADIFFDGHVNHGFTGIRLMQEVLNVSQDNVVGPITLNAINRSDSATLYNRYKERRIAFYYELVRRRPANKTFLNGWLNRMKMFNDYPVINNNTNMNGQANGGGLAALIFIAGTIFFNNNN